MTNPSEDAGKLWERVEKLEQRKRWLELAVPVVVAGAISAATAWHGANARRQLASEQHDWEKELNATKREWQAQNEATKREWEEQSASKAAEIQESVQAAQLIPLYMNYITEGKGVKREIAITTITTTLPNVGPKILDVIKSNALRDESSEVLRREAQQLAEQLFEDPALGRRALALLKAGWLGVSEAVKQVCEAGLRNPENAGGAWRALAFLSMADEEALGLEQNCVSRYAEKAIPIIQRDPDLNAQIPARRIADRLVEKLPR